MEHEEWVALFQAQRPPRSIPPRALTYRRTWDSACRPIQVTCDDGHDYVVKGSQAGRSAFNDQVVGRLASHLGAPVPTIGLVEIPRELIAMNRDMGHITPGIAHGSLFIPDCVDGLWFRHVDLPENRVRFALLSVLYGWMIGAEKQFFYARTAPEIVYSFDHDAFFPNGPNWTVDTLGGAHFPDVDEVIVDQCGLKLHEINEAAMALHRITAEIIASTIAAVPPQFGMVSAEERCSLAEYLWERCDAIRS